MEIFIRKRNEFNTSFMREGMTLITEATFW